MGGGSRGVKVKTCECAARNVAERASNASSIQRQTKCGGGGQRVAKVGRPPGLMRCGAKSEHLCVSLNQRAEEAEVWRALQSVIHICKERCQSGLPSARRGLHAATATTFFSSGGSTTRLERLSSISTPCSKNVNRDTNPPAKKVIAFRRSNRKHVSPKERRERRSRFVNDLDRKAKTLSRRLGFHKLS